MCDLMASVTRVSGQHYQGVALDVQEPDALGFEPHHGPHPAPVLEHAIIWIGKSRVGKNPVSYTLSAITSAFWVLQEDRGHEVPAFQTTSHMDYFRKQSARSCRNLRSLS